jgi:hypothetical protein
MKPLVKYCEGAVKSLNSQYAMTAVLGHSATMGAARERLIQDFLVAHLPELTSVVSGVIIDSSDRRSKQQDLVLMLKSMPRLPFASGHDLIFREGAIATFEIKTNIFPSGLDSIGENIESVRLLDPGPSDGVTEMGDLTNWPWNRVLSVVVTYEGAVLPAIATKLEAMVEAKRPDIYVDLTQGIMLKNDGLILPP